MFEVWQISSLTGKNCDQQLTYWKKKLEGYETLNLVTDYPRPLEIDFKRKSVHFEVDKGLSTSLREVAKSLEVSLHNLLLASYYLMLNSYTRQDDIVIGIPVVNRHYTQIENLIGFFVNTLALRMIIDTTSKITSFIKRIETEVIEAQKHQDLSFEKLVDELQVPKDTSRHPIFQVSFGVQEFGSEGKNISKILDGSYNNDENNIYSVAKFDIETFIDDSSDILRGMFNFRVNLYKEDTVKRFISTYLTILEQIGRVLEDGTANDSQNISDMKYLTKEEEKLQLKAWNATDKPYPHKETIHALFEEQASKNPENIAVTFEDVTLTYKELNKRANKLARYLITHHGIKADTLVALLLDRSEEMIVAILGVLKAGGAYVPLDPEYPDERIRHILDDTSSSVVVVNERNVERLRGIGIKAELVSIDSSELFKVLSIESSSNLTSHNKGITGSNLAYVIYTSGTTGKPKGVMQLHGNVVRLFTSTDDWFKFNNKDVWTLFHSYVFDFTVWEIWGALLYGGTLVIPSYSVTRDFDAFYELCRVNKVTVLTQTPSALYQFIDIASNKIHKDNEDKEDNGKLLDLRYIIFGGEALNFSQLKPWVDWYGYNKPKLINAYGITETTVIVTCKEITEQDSGKSSSIGRVLPDLKAYILNNSLQLLPIGAIGELYVGGAGLARGYLNNPELTNQKFIPNPFQTEEEKKDTTFGPNGRHSRLYKTGDLVRWLPGANLEYLGRADFQIKIRGFRVELGEIESVLSSHPDIKQCVVISKEHKTSSERNNKYIVAYYTSITGGKVEESALLKHISFKLPDYMIPSAFVYLDRLPLTVNGKIDRKALPNPELTGDSYVAPRSELERKICSIFAEVLGLDIRVVGIRDDFFRLGGNSILAIRLVTMINNSFKSHINVVDIFTHRQAALLINRVIQTKESFQTIVKLNNSNDKPNMFMIHPGCAGCEVYTSLSDKLSDSFSCFGLDSYNIFSRDKIDNLHQLAKYYLTYIDEVMAGAGQTSYHLFGWSLGGQIALEIASILEQKGCIDIKVYLLDTVLQDFYIQSLLDSFVYKELKAQDINRIFREEQMKLGYEESYLNRIISNASVEQKLAAQKISNILQHSEIILFKALLKDERFKTDNFKEAQSSIRNLKYNNVDKVVDQISQLEVIEMSNVDHSNIILEEIFIATRCALFAK